MKILPNICSMSINQVNLADADYTLVKINESNIIAYKNTERSNNIILNDLIENKAFATSLLYLNENYELEIGKFKDIFAESEDSIKDYLKDCETLLNRNVKIVEEAGIPLTNIGGYKIYESECGVLRGNGKIKLKESFNEIDLDDITLDYLKTRDVDLPIKDYVKCPECKNIFNGPDNTETIEENYDKDVYDGFDKYHTETNTVEVEKTTCPYCNFNEDAEEFSTAWVDDLEDAPNKEELVPGISSIYEADEGTQTTDIAPKVDQNMGLTKANPKKEYYDILLSDVDESADDILNRGFLKNAQGHYQRGNYILVKESEKYIAIRQDKLNIK